jgi:hypothetical protein
LFEIINYQKCNYGGNVARTCSALVKNKIQGVSVTITPLEVTT